MRKKNFFMLALAAFAFAACSNEDIVPGGENDGTDVIDPTGDAWVAISIKQVSKTLSRGLNNPDDQKDGTEAESKVADVKVVFFNGPNANSIVTKVVSLTPDEAGVPGQPTGGKSDAFQVPATSKTMLVIINSNSISTTITPGTSTFSDVNAIITAADLSTTVAKSNYFLMTNAKGDLEPSDDYGNTRELTLHKSAEDAEKSPQAIFVDRVVAKVRVYVAANASTVANIHSPGWVLNVTNKKYFPVSKRVKTWNETPLGDRGICISPFDIYKIGSYRVDPNSNSSDIGIWDENNTAAYDANYNYFSSVKSPSSTDWNDLATIGDADDAVDVEYCLENTQDEAYNVHAYTTQVLLKANFAPKGLTTVAGTTVDVAKDEDWMIMDGSYYTYATLLDYIEEELKNKYIDKDGTNYPIKITKMFNQYITDLADPAVPLLVPVTIPDVMEEVDAETQASVLKAKFAALEPLVKAKGAKKTDDVRYYSGGISYYKIMIKHDDSTKELNKFGEFGVVRNSIYDIHITGFNNPGFPEIPDPDPDTKDEEEDMYLSIQININPWTWYVQEEDI